MGSGVTGARGQRAVGGEARREGQVQPGCDVLLVSCPAAAGMFLRTAATVAWKMARSRQD